MKIGRPEAVRKPIPLTPLVDIVFLLLMFFMLTTTFTRFGQTTINNASSPQAISAPSGFPGVIIVVDGPNKVQINGSNVTIDDLVPRLNDFYSKGVNFAVVRVSKNSSVQDLVTALDTVKSSKIPNFKVAEQ